jgi:nucleoside-diphosphate-sugar epimerase
MLVDVRDVAQAHLLGLKKADAANKRFILVHSSLWMTQIAGILAQEWKPRGYSISTRELP